MKEEVMSYEQLKNPCNTKRRQSSTICIIYRCKYHMDSYIIAKYIGKSRFYYNIGGNTWESLENTQPQH